MYGSRLAAKLAEVSLRQLRYWVSKGLLRPSIHRAGRGGRDLYAYSDLVQAKAIGRLRKQGASLQRISRSLAYLRDALPEDESWDQKTLVTDGSDVFGLYAPRETLNLTHRSPGQRVFEVFLGDLVDELNKAGQLLGIGGEIEVDTDIQGGSPVLRGTRIPTRLIGELLEEGLPPAQIRQLYPTVTPAGITAAQEFERQLAAVV
jgi:uncharacterized protein (DUF433 family)/DNA-binding transcriptional MerR regulator